jgi:hypothetical protein
MSRPGGTGRCRRVSGGCRSIASVAARLSAALPGATTFSSPSSAARCLGVRASLCGAGARPDHPLAALNYVKDRLAMRSKKRFSRPPPVAGASRKCLSIWDERAIQNRDPRLSRSCPWDGRDRIGPSQETERRAYNDAGHDVRWNADHYAGHGMLETPCSRGATGAEPASPARGTPPPHCARQQRCLHRAGSARTIADAVPAVGRSLHSAARQQSQRADQST